MIKQVKSGKSKGLWVVVHCHGKDKGKRITKPASYRKTLARHRAIMASEARRKRV